MPEVFAEPLDFALLLEKALDVHLSATFGAYEGVNEIDKSAAARPLRGRFDGWL